MSIVQFSKLLPFYTLCAVFVVGCATTGGAVSPSPAPAFSLTSMDGGKVSISQFSGKVVVIDFWATWCQPCRERLPHLQALAADQELARKGLLVVAIDERENSPDIRSFLDQFHYTFTVLRDTNGTVARNYSVSSLPTTIVIGRDGNIHRVITAVTADSGHELDDAIARALQ
jgi:thiol-disulfide isomerase/thioredoxin